MAALKKIVNYEKFKKLENEKKEKNKDFIH